MTGIGEDHESGCIYMGLDDRHILIRQCKADAVIVSCITLTARMPILLVLWLVS
jgi:hypothetical protein